MKWSGQLLWTGQSGCCEYETDMYSDDKQKKTSVNKEEIRKIRKGSLKEGNVAL